MSLDSDIGRDALRLLTSREHSRRELQRKLLARGHDEAGIECALDELSDSGLLSDERVRKGFGLVRIRQELR